MAKANYITRGAMGNALSAQMPTQTIKSDWCTGTYYEDVEINDNWLVTYIWWDRDALIIECTPRKLAKEVGILV